MTTFTGFHDAAVTGIAAATGVADHAGVRRVLHGLAPHAVTLLAAVRSGHAPVTQIREAVAEVLQRERALGAIGNAQAVQLLTYGIDYIVATEGYIPVRAEPAVLHAGPDQYDGMVIHYVRRAETSLFQVIDGGQPVTLASSADMRRFGRAVLDRYARAGEPAPRRVFLWTIASGLFEVVAEGAQLTYFPSGATGAYRTKTTVTRLSVLCSEQDVSPIEAMLDLVMRSMRQFTVENEERTIVCYVLAHRQEALESLYEVVVDDTDADGAASEVDDGTMFAIELNWNQKMKETQAAAEKWPRQNDKNESEDRTSLPALLDFIMERQIAGALYVIYDGEVFLGQETAGASLAAAFLRDACTRLRRSGKGTQVVVLSAPIAQPGSLSGEVTHLTLPLPSRLELLAEVRRHTAQIDGLGAHPDACHPLQVTDALINIADAAAGMSLSDTVRVIRSAAQGGALAADEFVRQINLAKRAVVKRSAALELLDREPPRELALGGMEKFWSWLSIRHRVFKQPELAGHAGIDRRPRGVLILGIPGTGKSLAAKVIAREWQLPLVRLDMGAIQNKYVGGSEERMREAIRIVEAMSPCVLWIDEIDKGIAQGENTSNHSTDLNIRATLLTWLQENESAVFVVATANRFTHLPPELTRAGRFDARFFFGCPNREGCRAILKIHLGMRSVTHLSSTDLTAIAEHMHGFTGAEIEQGVLDALYSAFAACRSVAAADFVMAADGIKPLIRAAGRSLEEVWDLIEQGRVELASHAFLTRADVARLVDPESFSPMYCRLEGIGGWQKHATRATRLLMRDQFGMPAAVVLDTGDADWIYVQTNFRLDPQDIAPFKFLDQLDEVETNGVIDRLVVEHGLETIMFESEALLNRFKSQGALGSYSDLLTVLH